jgi:hypothetical protein
MWSAITRLNQASIDSLGLIRWPQHAHCGLGESDGCRLVYVNDSQCEWVQRCIQERGTLGPLGQSFLKQGRSSSSQCRSVILILLCHVGILVYVVMTALNTLSIGTFFR